VRRALVTGATGFLGGALVRRLVREGWQVYALGGRRPVPPDAAARLDAELHPFDGTRAAVDRAVAESAPDVVFHVAAQVLVEHGPDDVRRLVESNVTLGAELADAMVGAGVHRLVITGSHWEHYGGADYAPVNLYAATKAALRTVLRYFTSTTPLQLRVLTVFETYGAGDPRPKLITLLRQAAETGQPLALSPGEQLVDLVHVDDVAGAAIAAARTFSPVDDAPEREFAATSGARLTVRALVREVEAVLGRPAPVVWGGRAYRPREIMVPWIGSPPPEWKPEISLTTGLRETLRRAGA
jgi:nucleoside-diphosphate-sugar epimerase